MSSDSEARIHERLDEVVASIGEIKRDVAILAATCVDCRRVVMGNGNKPIDKRVAILEERSRIGSKWLWAGVALISSLVAGVVNLLPVLIGG